MISDNDYLNILKRTIQRTKIIYEDDSSLRQKIIDFFLKNPNPKDSVVHNFAGELGMEPDNLETQIYAILSDYLKIGKHKDSPDSEFDPNELAMGIKIESEHSDNPEICKEIAKDHLSEIKNYYTLLKQMEESAKKGKD